MFEEQGNMLLKRGINFAFSKDKARGKLSKKIKISKKKGEDDERV